MIQIYYIDWDARDPNYGANCKKHGKKEKFYSLMYPAFSFYDKGPVIKKLFGNADAQETENSS